MRSLAIAVLIVSMGAQASPRRQLRVCADPNSFPLSSSRTPGLEDELAKLIARDLDADVEYTWWAQRRGFYRNTLKAGSCDVVMGLPVGAMRPLVRTTRPYYRSTYAFVSRADRDLADLRSFDDPRLKTLRIGVQLVDDDGANPPPVHALARRGIIDNVAGYSVLGDYRRPDPVLDAARAVVSGEVDVAIVWGPVAGGFAAHNRGLRVTPVAASEGDPPMTFSIALGVRKGDAALAAELDRILAARAKDIAALLARWQVPLVAEAP